jgi:hypothetical protein
MSGGARPGAGRKLVKIDLEQLEKLCGLQCTDAEIAAWFHVSTRTIENRRKHRTFAEAMERGRFLRFHLQEIPPVPHPDGPLTLAITHRFPRRGFFWISSW